MQYFFPGLPLIYRLIASFVATPVYILHVPLLSLFDYWLNMPVFSPILLYDMSCLSSAPPISTNKSWTLSKNYVILITSKCVCSRKDMLRSNIKSCKGTHAITFYIFYAILHYSANSFYSIYIINMTLIVPYE